MTLPAVVDRVDCLAGARAALPALLDASAAYADEHAPSSTISRERLEEAARLALTKTAPRGLLSRAWLEHRLAVGRAEAYADAVAANPPPF